ncbi:MAG: MarR family transcriptional regulator [Sulfolobaceae archaeon]|nr:MarR family transcriptional regulator [Sulfolobales archaeon]MCQ4406893.1 MarR family transcriptional regulator [Sulfolobales archaeon]MDT7905984.1 MarR family transcriptional regulator [Sulfolobales archaeon]
MEQRQLEPWEMLLKSYKLMRKILQEEAVREGLTFNETSLLFFVNANGKANVTTLAKYLDVSKSSVVEMIDKLVRNGFLERTKDVKDRRVTYVTITDRGRAVLETVREKYKETINKVLSEVNDVECISRIFNALLKEYERRKGTSYGEPC